MAWTSIGTLGATQSKTADQASLSHTTTTNNVSAGQVVVVAVAVDNNQITDGDEGAVSSMTVNGESATEIQEWCNGQGTLQTGCTVSLWYRVLTGACAIGATITANFSNSTSRDASSITAWAFNPGSGATVTVENRAAMQTDAADPSPISVGGTRTVVVSDTFTRANETLTTPWVNTTNSLQIVTNRVRGVGLNVNNVARYGGTTLNADGWSKVNLATITSNAGCATFRHATGAETYYMGYPEIGDTLANLYRVVASAGTSLKSVAYSWTAGDILLQVCSTTLNFWHNSTILLAANDSNISAAGESGMRIYSNTAALELDNFESGNFASEEYLFISATAVEGIPSDSWTSDADYTSFDSTGTTGGADDTNITVRGGFRIFTGASDTYDASGTSRDYAQVMATLKEARLVHMPITRTRSPMLGGV